MRNGAPSALGLHVFACFRPLVKGTTFVLLLVLMQRLDARGGLSIVMVVIKTWRAFHLEAEPSPPYILIFINRLRDPCPARFFLLL